MTVPPRDVAGRWISSTPFLFSAGDQRKWDALLNRNYRAALSQLDAKERAELEAEERRWISERKVACDNVSENLGGTLQLLETDGCYLDWTARRAERLGSYGAEPARTA